MYNTYYKKLYYTALVYYDLKITVRNYLCFLSISVLTPVIFSFVFKILFQGVNNLFMSYCLLFLGLETLFTNLFTSGRHEFRCYSTAPIAYGHLLIIKNIKILMISVILVLSSLSFLRILGRVKFAECQDLALFLLPAIFALLGAGNVISLFAWKKSEFKFQCLFLFFHSFTLSVSTGMYFLSYKQQNIVLYCCFVSIVLGLYLISIRLSAKSLEKVKYKLLEL